MNSVELELFKKWATKAGKDAQSMDLTPVQFFEFTNELHIIASETLLEISEVKKDD